MQVTDSIRYVGVNDHQVDLFEDSIKCRMACHTIHM